MASDSPSHLTIILDLHPPSWSLSPLTLPLALRSLLAFSNAHLSLHHTNSLSFYGATSRSSDLLYSTAVGVHVKPVDVVEEDRMDVDGEVVVDNEEGEDEGNEYRPFKVMDRAVSKAVARLMREMELPEEGDPLKPIDLVGALGKALCHHNRLSSTNSTSSSAARRTDENGNGNGTAAGAGGGAGASAGGGGAGGGNSGRILIVSCSPDRVLCRDYTRFMACIFSAQKSGILIDSLLLSANMEDSTYLQQSSHLTGGAYNLLSSPEGLLQYLLMIALPPTHLRSSLNLPAQDSVDLRPTCFCHPGRKVEVGYVCSVCLSIFCSPKPVCATCKTKFPLSTLERFGFKLPKPPAKRGGKAGAVSRSASGTPAPRA
ncbi:transcription factor Tfb4 [Atractiella rhizophila]|nr:transcription factor Tfb4 [Atractiella rhizophila]